MQPVLFLPGQPPASLDALLKIGGLPERQAQVAVGHRRRGATLVALKPSAPEASHDADFVSGSHRSRARAHLATTPDTTPIHEVGEPAESALSRCATSRGESSRSGFEGLRCGPPRGHPDGQPP